MIQQLVHGGQLQAVALRYAIPVEQWLDLSTGIAPIGYPVGQIPADYWQRLPQANSDLNRVASDYYGSEHLLPIAGSQSLIQLLPRLCRARDKINCRVWLPKIGYKEHQKAWQQDGYELLFYHTISELSSVEQGDIVLLINPNNPSGELVKLPQTSALLHELVAKNALLIVDEAFMDSTPQHSLISTIPGEHLIVLRSVGKFFGLAGIRLGFTVAAPSWIARFKQALGPWSVNGPAQYVGIQALADKRWQQTQQVKLTTLSQALEQLLAATFKRPIYGTLLFKTVPIDTAPALFSALCQLGIYVRLCDEQNALRFGVPHEQGLIRLAAALNLNSIQTLLI